MTSLAGRDFQREVLAELEKIIDPCSANLGAPIGLVGMGVVEEVDIAEGAVTIILLPTFPNCMFRGVFEAEIETRLLALPWCHSVSVKFSPAEMLWDESRMTPAARARLGRRSKAHAPVAAGANSVPG